MQPLTINSNQGSQAYGNDPGGALMLDQIVNATVLEKVDDDLYLLQIGRHKIEAKVSAELQVGSEYQFVVEKNSVPPELALLNQEPQGRLDNGLTPEENRWILKLGDAMGKSSGEIAPKALLEFVRQLGFDIHQDPREVFKTLQPILELMGRIEAATPAVRQLMGQTLLFNIHSNGQLLQGLNADLWLEQVVRLTGEIPKWSETEAQDLIKVKQAIQESSTDFQKNLKAGLLGTSTKETALLEKNLTQIISSLVPKGEKAAEITFKMVQDLISNHAKRIFLASEPSQVRQASMPHLEKNEAIRAFQQSAPGLTSQSTSSLLEHFSNLGGRLEKLPVGDVVSSQLAWKGSTPSAMQIHRTGTVLHLVQDLPHEQRNISKSDLINQQTNKALPVILDKSLVNDPGSSSLAMNKMNEFSQQSSLPNSYHVDKLLQNWHQSGGSLSELRPNIDSIQGWSQFIEEFPELRHQLAEQLLKSPLFQQLLADSPDDGSKIVITKETANSLNQALVDGGIKPEDVPNKEMKAVQAVLQEVAGPGQQPSQTMVNIASWMMSKGIEITANSLSSIMSFYQGHDNMNHLIQGLQDVLKNMPELPPGLKDAGSALLHQLGDGGAKLKDVLSFYQKGNGLQLKQWLNQIFEHAQTHNYRDTQLLQQLNFLSQRIQSQESFLSGLKHYNIQAQRHDTPQLFELPFSFGGEIEHAFLKIYRRDKGSNVQNPEHNFKVVIDLDLDGLGKVRSEVSLFNKHLQLDFISPEQQTLKVLKDNASHLNERLDANELNASLGFKLKQVEPDPFDPKPNSKAIAPQGKAKIDLSA